MNSLEKKLTRMYCEKGTDQSEEERKLFMKIREGDEDSREIIVISMQGNVYKMAKRCNHIPGDHFKDLVQEGNFGLLKAIENYDVGRGIKFSVYAHPRISGSMLDYIRHEIKEGFVYIRRAAHPNMLYLDDCKELGGGEVSLLEIIPDEKENPLEHILKVELSGMVRENIENGRRGKIIELILKGDLSFMKIGERFGIGESRVCQIKRRFIDKLKNDPALTMYLKKPILQKEQI